MCHLCRSVGNGAEKNQRRDAEGAEERRGEEPFLSSFSAPLCESLRLCVKAVLTSAAAVPRYVCCAFSRLVPLRVLRRCKCKCSAGSRWPKRRVCKATQSHLKAATKPYTRHILRSTEPPQSHPKAEGGLRGGAQGRQNARDAGPDRNAVRRDSDAARTSARGERPAAFAVAGGRDRAAGGGGVRGVGGARALATGHAGTQRGAAPSGRMVAG